MEHGKARRHKRAASEFNATSPTMLREIVGEQQVKSAVTFDRPKERTMKRQEAQSELFLPGDEVDSTIQHHRRPSLVITSPEGESRTEIEAPDEVADKKRGKSHQRSRSNTTVAAISSFLTNHNPDAAEESRTARTSTYVQSSIRGIFNNLNYNLIGVPTDSIVGDSTVLENKKECRKRKKLKGTITIYTQVGSAAVRQLKKWFKKVQLPYQEINLDLHPERITELKTLLQRPSTLQNLLSNQYSPDFFSKSPSHHSKKNRSSHDRLSKSPESLSKNNSHHSTTATTTTTNPTDTIGAIGVELPQIFFNEVRIGTFDSLMNLDSSHHEKLDMLTMYLEHSKCPPPPDAPAPLDPTAATYAEQVRNMSIRNSFFKIDKDYYLVSKMRKPKSENGLKIGTKIKSLFRYRKAFSGDVFVTWLIENEVVPTRDAAKTIGQRFLDKNIMHEVNFHRKPFEDSSRAMYRFLQDEKVKALNFNRDSHTASFSSSAHSAITLTAKLRRRLVSLLKYSYWVSDDKAKFDPNANTTYDKGRWMELDYVKIASSPEWKATLETVYMLQRVNLDFRGIVEPDTENSDSTTFEDPFSSSDSLIGSSIIDPILNDGSSSGSSSNSHPNSNLHPNSAHKKEKKKKGHKKTESISEPEPGLTREERLAFFLNVYNILVIHGIIWYGWPENQWERMNFYQASGYVIGGVVYSLNDIETGILRGNKQKAGSLGVPFGIEDGRRKYMISGGENRIHFVLWRGSGKWGADLMAFSGEGLEAELSAGVREFLQDERKGMKVVVMKGLGMLEIWVSKLFAWNYIDFGETEKDVCKWLERVMGIEIPEKEKVKIKYLDWSWKHCV
eukprot:TRINITY_DN149_c0_g1_i2.p1 TRINITY_DN149_c0_g1~~TRINITY_DN149_c0_g1_i2.p1  ORF type:complete len:842 (-),score=193.28 TRINITY_DN149_c0_g1_i2:99-2624(-)